MIETAIPHRRELLDRTLLYLFSYNVEVSTDRENIGLTSAGLRVNVVAVPSIGSIYHVLRERVIGGLGFKAVTGRVADGGDYALIREDDVILSNVRLTMETDDGATIDGRYRGVASLGQGGFRAVAGDMDKLGTPTRPLVVPLVVTPTYETSDEKYKWLTELQCMGYGQIEIIANLIRRITYDVYAMT